MRRIETLKRSIVKSVIWRLLGLVILGGAAYIVTSDPAQSLVLTVFFNGVRVVLYVPYEQVWDRIAWGRRPDPATADALRRAADLEFILCSGCGTGAHRPDCEVTVGLARLAAVRAGAVARDG